MRFEDFIARPALLSHLRETFGAGRASHAYIFVGPEGTGKKTLARLCAQALFCQAAPSERPCGLCPACQRFPDNNPDVLFLQVPSDKTVIPVESVRALTDALSDRAYAGGRRAVIIDDADRMQDVAQNALLKTLEEPPEGVTFFLIVSSLNVLLPTVVSRCRVIRLSCLTVEETENALSLRSIDTRRARLIAELSQGSLGTAYKLCEDDAFRDLAERVRSAKETAEKPGGMREAAAILKDKDEAPKALMLLEAMAREEMRQGKAEGARLMRAVITARKRIKSYVSWQYVLEQMFLEAAEGSIDDGNGHRSTL